MQLGGGTQSRAKRRGFTLTELMIVVAMIGILATLAIVGYQRYLRSAGSAEVKAVMQGIRIAEEAYKSETFQYKDCSDSLTDWYPYSPSDKKSDWDNSNHKRYKDWKELNVITDGPVKFGYAVVAGVAPDVAVSNVAYCGNWASAHSNIEGPWFVVSAGGDQDADGIQSRFAASSRTGQICVDKSVSDDE
ncbi:type IV pilin protein [Polyangium aurulentum]|uniref:type IV pilin protein n=1 Tax=Polyangium aurulentum TaxID=2567896 RepID=UPI0010AEE331|nr:prepilin-type N-terminal cleavage/methylation domain-containing protein [Polyangium aurulentum]UQA54903.1 prepilin-type N-terminal cleavage/methylation domain-containing protein [Polyangium aurulentum]